MKVFIDHSIDQSGKGKFLRRMMPELKKLGAEFTGLKECDIILGIKRFREGIKDDKKRTMTYNKPTVLRVDGLHFEANKRSVWSNNIVRQDIKRADGVIWQTEFCKKAHEEILGTKAKKEAVIFNGANPKDYEHERTSFGYDTIIITSAKWFAERNRDNKRLPEMVRVMEEYLQSNKDTGFVVVGPTKGIESDCEQIIFTGHQPEKELQKILCSADAMLYSAHYDWCPNSVVEALVCGLPVIYHYGSGVEEIVGDHGVGIQPSSPPKIKMRKNDKIPPITDRERDEIFDALDNWLLTPREPQEHLFVENIARQYYNFLKSVLGGDNA